MTVRPSDPVRNAAEGVTPDSAGWRYLSFKIVHLEAGARLASHTKAEETALIWLGGRATVEGFGTVGGRVDVWDGKPFALLLPPGIPYDLSAESPCDLAIVSAPAQSELPPRLIRPDDVRVETRGSGVTERRIHWIVAEQDPAARLILVEVFTPAGHWSTIPRENAPWRSSTTIESVPSKASPSRGSIPLTGAWTWRCGPAMTSSSSCHAASTLSRRRPATTATT